MDHMMGTDVEARFAENVAEAAEAVAALERTKPDAEIDYSIVPEFVLRIADKTLDGDDQIQELYDIGVETDEWKELFDVVLESGFPNRDEAIRRARNELEHHQELYEVLEGTADELAAGRAMNRTSRIRHRSARGSSAT